MQPTVSKSLCQNNEITKLAYTNTAEVNGLDSHIVYER
jgi:hypothetical protein